MSRTLSGRRARRPRSAFRKFLDYLLGFAILALLAVIAARYDRVDTRQVAGAVTVNDGDSLTLGGTRIRLVGIDAPEFDQVCHAGGVEYRCGRKAREVLAELVAGGGVSCEGWETDRYGRLLAVCKAGSVDLNRRQVEEGWAVAYGDYFDAERAARDAKRGLWAGTFDRPRDWRDMHGGLAESEHDLFGAAMNWLRQLLGFS
jgi:endonuclease YncB( thermonuclease family)